MKRPRPNEELRISSSKNLPLIEKKHHQIVEGACRVFFEKGYHPTTIRMIAKACGMSMGQLYHYIHSKDDVLYLVHKHMQKVWYDYIKKSDMEMQIPLPNWICLVKSPRMAGHLRSDLHPECH